MKNLSKHPLFPLGKANDAYAPHLSIEVPGENSKNERLETVESREYDAL